MSNESYPTSGSTLPDMEDINRDNTLSETESYYQYKVSMRPGDMKVGSNYVVDEIEYEATFANGNKSKVKWYQFKIPIYRLSESCWSDKGLQINTIHEDVPEKLQQAGHNAFCRARSGKG